MWTEGPDKNGIFGADADARLDINIDSERKEGGARLDSDTREQKNSDSDIYQLM